MLVQLILEILLSANRRRLIISLKKRIHTREDSWIVCENAVPAIVDKATFELVQNMFKSNKNRFKGDGITNSLLLRGLIFCKECGHTFGFRAHKQVTKK